MKYYGFRAVFGPFLARIGKIPVFPDFTKITKIGVGGNHGGAKSRTAEIVMVQNHPHTFWTSPERFWPNR